MTENRSDILYGYHFMSRLAFMLLNYHYNRSFYVPQKETIHPDTGAASHSPAVGNDSPQADQ
ncbi:MAG: hypothetical protein NT047_04890 [Deltaproteobacteria bacterium]|nr:hypothetical protein [Deltaproteobacteria bacterium]